MENGSTKKINILLENTQIDESSLFTNISKIIEKRKHHAGIYANFEVMLTYWEKGHYIYNRTKYISLAKENQQCQ